MKPLNGGGAWKFFCSICSVWYQEIALFIYLISVCSNELFVVETTLLAATTASAFSLQFPLQNPVVTVEKNRALSRELLKGIAIKRHLLMLSPFHDASTIEGISICWPELQIDIHGVVFYGCLNCAAPRWQQRVSTCITTRVI